MASVAEAARVPRFGSAAELAAYAGLSVKTIRRLVGAGKLRGRKVGRRLLIPFEDIDAHILGAEDDARILKIEDHGRPILGLVNLTPAFPQAGPIPFVASWRRGRSRPR